MPEPRRTFGPVVLVGLAAGILAAVASARAWVVDAAGTTATDPLGLVADAGEMPLAAALSLVVLACWGVLLVTRGRVRRAVAVLGLLAALGLVATVVTGWVTLDEQVVDAVRAQGLTGDEVDVETTGWFWGAALGAVGSVLATAAAVRFAPAWPEMGTRYDAPAGGGRPQAGSAAATDAAPEEASNLDLWKAMDEGRDPTA